MTKMDRGAVTLFGFGMVMRFGGGLEFVARMNPLEAVGMGLMALAISWAVAQ